MSRSSDVVPADERDAALFRAHVGPVTPLPLQNHIAPPRPSLQARVRVRRDTPPLLDTLSDYSGDNAPEDYLHNGLSRIAFRRLRRGSYPVQDCLDMHGLSGDGARQLLQQFLHSAENAGMRCVQVIHGKGTNSPGGHALLRTLTRNWLTQHPQVLAFCPAQPESGGSGAVLILLRVSS